MEQVYSQTFFVSDLLVDRHRRMKPSAILYLTQEISQSHCNLLRLDWETLAQKGLFWAVIRHGVRIRRLPTAGEHLTLQTWPMPTTRTGYPRNVVAFDEAGQEVFRVCSLWVLMSQDGRSLVLPRKSGVEVNGVTFGTELEIPGSLTPKQTMLRSTRRVCFSDLDRNGHTNNARYLDWVADLMDSDFHKAHVPKEMQMCYFNESREGDILQLTYQPEGTGLFAEVSREAPESHNAQRIFAIQFTF